MASTVKRGFLNTAKGKKAIQLEPPTWPKHPTPNTKHPEASKTLIVPLPYGKVKDVEIDKEYDYERKVERKPTTAGENIKNDAITMTSIPPQRLNAPSDPDGHTEWLVKGNTMKKVLNTPGYPRPIPKTRRLNFVVKATATMGMGMFATRDILYGDLVFSERPLLIFPRNLNLGYDIPAHYSPEQFNKVILVETEKKLERMISRMREEDRNAYMELANSHKEDGSGPLVGIMRTNGFSAGDLADGPHGAPITATNGYLAICKLGSRINHSCVPNVGTDFEIASFSMLFTAVADIKAGEQIVFSYCTSATKSSKAERAKKLLPYGIVCTCPACEGTE